MIDKIVLNVEFEFYPGESEAWSDYSDKSAEDLKQEVQAELEQGLNSIAGDGLWWNFKSLEAV